MAQGLGIQCRGMSGQCVPQENLADLGSNSSCLTSSGASSANKVTRAVAGEPDRVKHEVQPVSNLGHASWVMSTGSKTRDRGWWLHTLQVSYGS